MVYDDRHPYDECHPDVPCSDWDAFCKWVSPYPFEKVLDRNSANLPDWFVPLARGAAIAGPRLLHMAGYRTGLYLAPGWVKPQVKPSREHVFKDLGRNCLIAFKCGALWRIGLDVGALSRPHNYANFALVHLFGSTPILTRTYQEATYLAEFCYKAGHNTSLWWVHECPDDVHGAIEYAHRRCINEKLSRAAP